MSEVHPVDHVISRGRFGPEGGFRKHAMVVADNRTLHLVEQDSGLWSDALGRWWRLS